MHRTNMGRIHSFFGARRRAEDAATIARLEPWLPRMRSRVAATLLPLYNDAWRSEGAPAETHETVMQRLGEPVVDVDAKGNVLLYFDDDGVFFGYGIAAELDDGWSDRTLPSRGRRGGTLGWMRRLAGALTFALTAIACHRG